jgi:hypothetical protein
VTGLGASLSAETGWRLAGLPPQPPNPRRQIGRDVVKLVGAMIGACLLVQTTATIVVIAVAG